MEKYQTLLSYFSPFHCSTLSPSAFLGDSGALACTVRTTAAEKWEKSGFSHEPMPHFEVSQTKWDPKIPMKEFQPFMFWYCSLLGSCKANGISRGYLPLHPAPTGTFRQMLHRCCAFPLHVWDLLKLGDSCCYVRISGAWG